MPIIESLITIENLARLCHISVQTAKRWMKKGRTPPPVRLNRCLRFRASEIDEWIRDGCPNWAASAETKDFERSEVL